MLYRTLKYLPTIKVIRTVHNAGWLRTSTGTFMSLDAGGKPVAKEVNVTHRDPDNTFVQIPSEIGYALQAGSVPSNGMSLGKDPDKHPLTFFHETRTFAQDERGFPRLQIPQDMPRQNDTNKSTATLFLTGAKHEIVLDGTPDAAFASMASESIKRLKPALDLLKDM